MFSTIRKSFVRDQSQFRNVWGCHNQQGGFVESLVSYAVSTVESLTNSSSANLRQLFIAASEGNVTSVSSLLESGIDPDGNCSHVSLYLVKRSNVRFDLTPLHFAAVNGRLKVVELLISFGANVNASTNDGLTPLHLAAGCGYRKIVNLLLDRGASVNCESNIGITPLHFAAEKGNVDLVKLLISRGSSVNSRTREIKSGDDIGAGCVSPYSIKKWTPLHVAVKLKRYCVVKALLMLERTLKMDDVDALQLANADFYSKIVECLIDLDQFHDMTIEKNEYQKLFEVAISKMCVNTVKLLIKNVNVNAKNDLSETPLHRAITLHMHKSGFVDAIKVLLENGADTDAENNDGQTPLDYAVYLPAVSVKSSGNIYCNVVQLLLDKGCSTHKMLRNLKLLGRVRLAYLQTYQLLVSYYLTKRPGEQKPELLNTSKNANLVALSNFWDQCVLEMSKLTRNISGLSLYNVLVEKNMVSVAFYTSNMEVMDYCVSDDFKFKYPIYSNMIWRKLQRGQQLKKLIIKLDKLKISVLASESKPEIFLESSCLLHVVNYLSTSDVYNLIRASTL